MFTLFKKKFVSGWELSYKSATVFQNSAGNQK